MSTLATTSPSCSVETYNFINSGVACYCLVKLKELDLLQGRWEISDLNAHPQKVLLRAIFITLSSCWVVERSKDFYLLTPLGEELCSQIGIISLVYSGYGRLLTDHQLGKTFGDHLDLLNLDVIAQSSFWMGENCIDPLLLNLVRELSEGGTICDLGCGTGQRLAKIHTSIGNPGLGIEYTRSAVLAAQSRNKISEKLEFEQRDITSLNICRSDVEIVMQTMVFHDFTPTEYCSEILNRCLSCFPNMQYFFYIDVVTSDSSDPVCTPGFEYLHGLLNIPTRTYTETLEVFAKSKFTIKREIPIQPILNTFCWVLESDKGI